MTIAFVTLGCKVNQADSDVMRQRMAQAGYACVEAEAFPDVLVINSCAVTAESERKTRQKLRHYRAAYPDCILVLTGCAAQLGRSYPQADIVLGHQDAADLPRHIEAFRQAMERVTSISPHCSGELFSDEPIREAFVHTRAHLKIEDGCNQFCSYCIIPHARGRVRSRPLADIRQELISLDAQGFAEVIMVGINLAAYGSDLGCDLIDALQQADRLANIKRIRLGSLEPDLLNESLLSKLSNHYYSNIELCPHFHLSLQSGCDSVLRRMNRHYSTMEYYALVTRLRSLFPGAAITTDIMVGFPGESEAEFQASLDFVRSVGFAQLHVFPYSPRPGTPAAAMPDQLTRAEKQIRAKAMLTLAQESQHIFLLSNIGKTLHVLPEEPHPLGGMLGYSETYVPVHILDAEEQLRGQIIPVKIHAVEGDQCIGTAVR